MKRFNQLILATCLTTSLSGCIIIDGEHDWKDDNWKSQQKNNRKIISGLQLESTRAAVISQLGAPNFSEAFKKADDEYRILYYRTQHKHSDGETSKDETTPLVFKNDQLIGWGEAMLASIR